MNKEKRQIENERRKEKCIELRRHDDEFYILLLIKTKLLSAK